MLELLSVDNTFFTVFDYSMSYIEFIGTLLYLWSIWLIARKNILTWPVGIMAVILYFILFYQIQLYSDMLEQVYYLGTGIYGWYVWHQVGAGGGGKTRVRYNTLQTNIALGVGILIGSLILAYLMGSIHNYFPSLFGKPASFVYLDAVTTVMSFTAQILLIYRRVESWWLWVIVDVLAVGLYFEKGVLFIALLYVVYLILAVNGLREWRNTAREITGFNTDKQTQS